MRAEVITPNNMTPNKQHSKIESTSLETPHFAYTLSLCFIQEKPTAQIAHLVFANTKANA